MDLKELNIKRFREKVLSGETRPERWRRIQLEKVKELISKNEQEIIKALADDLGKPSTEALFEIIALKQELKIANKNLSNWMMPKRIDIPIWLKPGHAKLISEPLGCVLIIGPWNYPFMLTLQPLVSALAAGNTAIIKPSEYAPATSDLIEKLVSQHFENDVVKVVQGDGEFAEKLLIEKFDHIFFTGGGEIGRKVMSSAARHLTPVTLELGGRNPAIILSGANIDVTAKRIVWGKSLNSGQTCLAPNHLFVQKELKDILIQKIKDYIKSFYGENPEDSKEISNINIRQFDKITRLIETARSERKIISGGKINHLKRKVSPTIINVQNIEDPIISDEIFGPIIPIITINNLNDAIKIIQKAEKPLAIYMFGGSDEEQRRLEKQTSSGGICFNDVIIQAGIPELPFGGVGTSGTGYYHGKAGFKTFSHTKSILSRPFWLDLKFRYPPYKIDVSLIKNLFR